MSNPRYPRFRRSHRGDLLLSDSPESRQVAAAGRPAWSAPLSADTIDREARERVQARQGNLSDEKDVLGEYILQSGKYRGKSFLWLLENVPGYVGWYVVKMEEEGPDDKSNVNQRDNKSSLKRYVEMFEEGRIIIRKKKLEKSTSKSSSVSSKFQGLAGREMPTHVLQRRVQSLCSPAKIKPNIHVHSVQMSLSPEETPLPSTVTALEVATVETQEDRDLVAALESIESAKVTEISQETQTLYQGWKSTLPKVDHEWVSKTFFRKHPTTGKIEFRSEKFSQLWHEPPQPVYCTSVRNKMHHYFGHRFFLWAPVNTWAVRLLCPHTEDGIKCEGVLTRAGIHQKTRVVLDVDSYYTIASEYLACSSCRRKVIAWAHNVISQLDNDKQHLFPCIITAKLACDRKVVALLRNRGLGNSSSMVCRQIEEEHSDRYLRAVHHYLAECRRYKSASESGLVVPMSFQEPPEMMAIPRHRWLMKVYQLDVLQRLVYIKASITSIFGKILKMDSTKKITKKLAGQSAKTAMWATNIGNEHGQVIMTVLTTGEGQGLRQMIDGVINRYRLANVNPPELLYVDRDCCGGSAIARYFHSDWPYLNVRLDIWHFMRRLSIGCTTDAHPLYGVFMGRISHCIFRWDEEDLRMLKKAKRSEMDRQHISNPSDSDVLRAITKNELTLHCRRVTRGTEDTVRLISRLIDSLDGEKGLDILGVPLIDTLKMREIWGQQSRHVGCIQDPENVQLYTCTGTLLKGGVRLPTYRCARGSTSLESFHLHMARFIPGTLASDVNFQVYVLDGVFRWNENRRRDALIEFKGSSSSGSLSYDGELQQAVNKLSSDVLGKKICPHFVPPKKYTGELLGVEYLFAQSSGIELEYAQAAEEIEEDDGLQIDESPDLEDEGYAEPDVEDLTIPVLGTDETIPSGPSDEPGIHAESSTRPTGIVAGFEELIPAGQEVVATKQYGDEQLRDDSDIGPDNIAGYSCVLRLASALACLREQSTPLTSSQADNIIKMWGDLSDFDKLRTKFPMRAASSPGPSRFKSPRKQVALGVTSIERAILGPNATRASWPNCNRYVEATVEKLVAAYRSDRRSKTSPQTTTSRWNLIRDAYSRIQGLISSNMRIMALTDIQLPSLNLKTIQQWYNKKGKDKDLQVLLQGIDLPQPSMSGTGTPAAKRKLNVDSFPVGEGTSYTFTDNPDTTGTAKLKPKHQLQPSAISSPIINIQPYPISTSLTHPIQLQTTQATQPLPLLTIPASALPLQQKMTMLLPTHPSPTQTLTVSPTPPEGQRKRKYVRKTTTVRCGQCGEERLPPQHKQYMGYRYCGKTTGVSFPEWRANLQARGVARKKHL